MKIKKDYLERFVKKASLNGNIMAINMDFTDTGVHASVTNQTSIALTKTKLSKDKFTDYKNFGEIFIKNTASFIKSLQSFQGDISIEQIEDYMLLLSNEERDGYIILGSELVCENKHQGDLPNVKSTTKVTLNKKDFTQTIKDMNDLGVACVGIKKKGDVLTLEVGVKGESDFFINKYKNIAGEGDAQVSVGNTIIKLFESIDGEFILNFGNDTPILVTESNDGIDFTCIIAPLVSTN